MNQIQPQAIINPHRKIPSSINGKEIGTMLHNDQLTTPPLLPSPDMDYRMDYFHYKPVGKGCGGNVSPGIEASEESTGKPHISVNVKNYCGDQQFVSPIELEDCKKFTPNMTPYNFLLVDDNFINLKILEKILHKLYPNARVQQTQDSTTILLLVSTQQFDIVFLDIEMPMVTGIQLAQMIRLNEKLNKMGLIAVTTRSLPAEQSLYRQVGIDHTLAKPLNYSFSSIISSIDGVLSKRV